MSKTPKKYFNYRVILDTDSNGHQFYSIRGVHYDNYGKIIMGWDAEPLTLTFDQGDSITSYLGDLGRAAEEPVLRVIGDTLQELGERPAEMFVANYKDYPAPYRP